MLKEIKISMKFNALSNWMTLAVNVIIGFLLTPFIITKIGAEGYGLWNLVSSFVGYYGLLNLGVTSAINRYIARYTAQKNLKDLNKVANTALAMFTSTGLIAISISLIFSGIIADFFNIQSQDKNDFINLICIIGITTGVSFPSNVFFSIVSAKEHIVSVNIVTLIQALIRVSLTVLLLNRGLRLTGVGYATLASNLFALCGNYILFKIFAGEIKIKYSYLCRHTLKTLLLFGSASFITSIGDILRFNIDNLVIGKIIGTKEIGIYNIASLLVRYLMYAVNGAMSVFTPRFAKLSGLNSVDELKGLFIKSLQIASAITCSFILLFYLLGSQFIILWVGDGFRLSYTVLCILSFGFMTDLVQFTGLGVLRSINKHYWYAIFTIIEGILNLVISLLLAPKYGIIGVAMGTAISMGLIKIIVQPIYICKIININLFDYIKSIIPPVFIFIVIYSIANIFFSKILAQQTSIFRLVASTIIILLLFLISNFAFSKYIRKELIKILNDLF